MLKDITLGQYFPGDSIVHRLDPRMKIIMAVIYITAIFSASSMYTLIGVFLFNIVLVMLSGIPAAVIIKALRPLVFIIAFTGAVNIFMIRGERLLVGYGIINIYLEGLMFAAFMILRIIALISATSVLISYTTTPTVLTDAIERLLSPLKKIKMPVHEFALMMSIALRFIPTLIEEIEKIINAQKARGADFYSGNLVKRAKALVPVLLPLIISAFRRAEELATAMECRCYKGGEGRTKMKQLRYAARDFAALAVSAAVASAVFLVQRLVL